MSEITTGFHTTGEPIEGEITETPSGKFRFQLGDTVIEADTEEELQAILEYIALQRNVPVEELEEKHIPLNFQYGEFRSERDPNNRDLMVYSLTDKGRTKIDEFRNANFFGDHIPAYPPGSETYLEANLSRLDAMTGMRLQATLHGLAGTAQSIYDYNYGGEGDELPPIPNADLNPNTLALLKQFFGPNTAFNQGHLNTLKMMGLVDGSGGQPASSWTLNSTGTAVLGKFSELTGHFISHSSLLGLPTSAITQAEGVPAYFNAQGFIPPNDAAKVEDDAQEILDALPEEGNVGLPAGTKLDDASIQTLNQLFNLPEGNTSFTINQLNTAVAMGLLTYDPATQTVAITPIGNIYLQAAIATPAEETPEDAAIPTPPALDQLIWAQHVIGTNWDEFDSPDNPKGVDNVISTKDLERMMEKYPPGDPKHEAAKIMLEGREGGLTEPLFRGNANKLDGKFSRGDFDYFAASTNAIKAAVTTPGDTPEAVAARERPGAVIEALQELKRFFPTIDVADLGAENDTEDGRVSIQDIIKGMIESDDPKLQAAGQLLKEEYDKPGHGLLSGLFSGDHMFSEDELDAFITLGVAVLPEPASVTSDEEEEAA